MRYSQSEKMEIIRMVEESNLPVKRTLQELDVPKSTFYGWYQRYESNGFDGLKDRSSGPNRFWNRIPDTERAKVVKLALKAPEKTPRELAFNITDKEGYFISESSVYRILKAFDLMTSPAYIVLSPATSSNIQPKGLMNSGRPILPFSRSTDGASIISQVYWMITHDISLPGNYSAVCPPLMSRNYWIWHLQNRCDES